MVESQSLCKDHRMDQGLQPSTNASEPGKSIHPWGFHDDHQEFLAFLQQPNHQPTHKGEQSIKKYVLTNNSLQLTISLACLDITKIEFQSWDTHCEWQTATKFWIFTRNVSLTMADSHGTVPSPSTQPNSACDPFNIRESI